MLIIPAWHSDRYVVVKMVSIFPDNAVRGLASVQGIVTLIDAVSGQPLAMLDGQEITLRRTAAVPVLAAQCLARADAARLLLMGTGALGGISPAPALRFAPFGRSMSGTERLHARKSLPRRCEKKGSPPRPL